jgi:hypothetical protein
MNKALNEVRSGESRRMALEGLTPVLQKSRWLLLKREENLKSNNASVCATCSAMT